MKHFFLLFGLVYSVIFLKPSLVFAQSQPIANSITVSPAFQEAQLEESAATTSKTITVTNTSNQPVTLEVLPSTVDQENLSGRISFELFSGAANQTFPFLSFSVDRFVIEPNKSQEITVNIDNRSSLRPGGTYVAIVFRTVLDTPPSQQVILPAVASLLLINKVGGETYNLSLKEVTGLPKYVTFSLPSTIGVTFANEGNTHIQPRGTISVFGLFDRLLAQSTINESSLYILPGRQRIIQQSLKQAQAYLPFDVMWLEVIGTSGNDRTPFKYETSFIYVAPWFLILCAVISGLALASTLYFKKQNSTTQT